MIKSVMSIKTFIIVLIVTFFVSVLGATVAYFLSVQRSNDGDITGNVAMVNLTLNVNRVLPVVPSTMVPQLSNGPLENAIKNGCVDSNGNSICQVYKINITNGSGASVVVDGRISFYGDIGMTTSATDGIPNLKWMLVSSFDESDISLTVLGNDPIKIADSDDRNFITSYTFDPTSTYTYYVVVWLNETGNEQPGGNHSFYGNVSFISSTGSGVTAVFNQ